VIGSGTEPSAIHAKSKRSKELRAKGKELRNRLGEYRRRGEFDEATAYLQCALRERSFPERTIFDQLAQLYASTGQFELARVAVKRIIELGDASPKTELQLAILEAKTDNASLAREIFAKVVSANPELHQAKLEYGCFLCEQGELAEGIPLIDSAIALAPDTGRDGQAAAKRVWEAANRLWNAGERTKAITCAQKAAELAPEHVAYHVGLANFRSQSGDQRDAISGLKSAAEQISELDLQPVDAKNLIKMAATLQSHGELHAAWRVLEKIPSDHQPPQRLPYVIKAQKLRSIVKYFQGDIAAAHRETLAYVKLLDSPMLRLPLTDLLDECMRQARADDQEPALAKWLWPKLNLAGVDQTGLASATPLGAPRQ